MWRLFCLLLKPDHRVASYYTKGFWSCGEGELYDFLFSLTEITRSPLHTWFQLFNRYPIRDQIIYRIFPMKVSENIAIHYNTSPEFMRLLLGETLEYTCAFFEDDDESLDVAQRRKIDTVIERLSITEEHQVLDLGCGWGQIAEQVAEKTNASVTGVNLTPNQIDYAKQNSSERTAFVLTDYRNYDPSASFERIYSIGMLEHVGRGNIDEYLRKIADFLKDDGRALVHCIVRREKRATNSWIDEEVFPGAYIPQLSEIVDSIERSELRVDHIHIHAQRNYFHTLKRWLENFYANRAKLRDILEPRAGSRDVDTILLIWEFYLAASRIAFAHARDYCYNVQVVLAKPSVFQPSS